MLFFFCLIKIEVLQIEEFRLFILKFVRIVRKMVKLICERT